MITGEAISGSMDDVKSNITEKVEGSWNPEKRSKMYEEKMMGDEKVHAKHKMMSLSEITENLYEEFPDEIYDANHYMDMAKSAYDMGHEELAYYLCEIAKDEFTHTMFIHHHLKESGMEISTEWHKEWEELENRFRKYFQ